MLYSVITFLWYHDDFRTADDMTYFFKNVMTLYSDVMKYFPSFLPPDVFLFNVLFNVFDVLYNVLFDDILDIVMFCNHDVPLDTMPYILT